MEGGDGECKWVGFVWGEVFVLFVLLERWAV